MKNRNEGEENMDNHARYPQEPAVYFVILNWNQAQMTIECLESLQKQSYPKITIIVVDNGSVDGSPEKIRGHFPGVTVLENEKNEGYSKGNNIGIRYALMQGANYIFLLNNDTVVEPTMLSLLMDVANSDDHIGIAGPTMYYFDQKEVLWGGENSIDWQRAQIIRKRMGERVSEEALNGLEPKQVDFIDSCALLIKREVLDQIGFMDEKYFINFDDIDLNVRTAQSGYKVMYVPKARMWHKVSAAIGIASPATTYYMTRNTLLFFWSHGKGVNRFLGIIKVLSRHIHNIGAWTIKSKYHNKVFQQRRAASIMGMRDFFMGVSGKMPEDVVSVCYSK